MTHPSKMAPTRDSSTEEPGFECYETPRAGAGFSEPLIFVESGALKTDRDSRSHCRGYLSGCSPGYTPERGIEPRSQG